MRSAFSVQDFSPIFWYKYYVVCAIPLCMSRTFFLHFCLLCFVRDALLPLLHFTTGDFFLFNYYPCKTLRRTIGLACGFLLELNFDNLFKRFAIIKCTGTYFLYISWYSYTNKG